MNSLALDIRNAWRKPVRSSKFSASGHFQASLATWDALLTIRVANFRMPETTPGNWSTSQTICRRPKARARVCMVPARHLETHPEPTSQPIEAHGSARDGRGLRITQGDQAGGADAVGTAAHGHTPHQRRGAAEDSGHGAQQAVAQGGADAAGDQDRGHGQLGVALWANGLPFSPSPLVLWSYGTCEPSMPSADITERCSRGKDSGAGTPSGDLGFTAPTVVSKTEKQPEKQQVAKTHLKSSALSNQSPVVLYIRTPRPVTAAGSHWKNRSPTSRTA